MSFVATPEAVFQRALAFTWAHEKGPGDGKVDDPADYGGRTNCGVTQHVYDPSGKRDVWEATVEELQGIYHDFWVASRGPTMVTLSDRLAIAHFDSYFLLSPKSAVMILQDTVGARKDGLLGGMTWAAIKRELLSEGEIQLITAYCICRRNFHRRRVMVDPSQAKFLGGWIARVNDLQAYLLGGPS